MIMTELAESTDAAEMIEPMTVDSIDQTPGRSALVAIRRLRRLKARALAKTDALQDGRDSR